MSKVIYQPKRGMVQLGAAAYYREAVQRELTARELRLLAYIQYVVMNGGKVESIRVNQEEVQILKALAAANWIMFTRASIEHKGYEIAVTPSFWQHMNYVLFECYVSQVAEVTSADSD